MFFVYSVLYTLSLIVLLPYFLLNRKKYLTGFKQRLGFIPPFSQDGKPVVWIHCVSVGETQAARPLVRNITKQYPKYRIVVSTTTKTGFDLASDVFRTEADLIFYNPFDIPFVVDSVMKKIKPNIVLIMETEIWINFIRRAQQNHASVVIVNGRMSERSVSRYSWIRGTIKRTLKYVNLALMQTNGDASRIISVGIRARKVKVTGNLKFDQKTQSSLPAQTAYFKERFGFNKSGPVIVAASTHNPEETWILEAFKQIRRSANSGTPRLIMVPRHPERFDEVARAIEKSGLRLARRTDALAVEDDLADVVLVDSIGELRAVYPIADIVFVGGSLVPRGGQSVLEPALAGKAIITGNDMHNFETVVEEFTSHDAFIMLPQTKEENISECLAQQFLELIENDELRERLGKNALAVMNDNRGATSRTLKHLQPLLQVAGNTVGR